LANKRKNIRWRSMTPEQKRAYHKEHYAKHRAAQSEGGRRHRVRKNFGIELEVYDKIMASNTTCHICGAAHNLVLDHCHVTRKLRGVLCGPCNSLLGMAYSNEDTLAKAIKYLQRFNNYYGLGQNA
jgi:hypothetical protein